MSLIGGTTAADGIVAAAADGMAATPFRTFTVEDFRETSSWRRLTRILAGNGGCYGLYGPRGAGKTWLMRMAIEQANNKGGLGLWFPCPSEYDATAFLSTLSDNLANSVERRFIRNSLRAQLTRRLQLVLSVVIAVPVLIATVSYVVRGLAGKAPASATMFSAVPLWLWQVVGGAIALLAVLLVAQMVWEREPAGRLAREATGLRERIRYTVSMKLGSEIGVSGGRAITGSLKRSSERALDERPATLPSLVFEFRNLAELIVRTLDQPVVVGIDELDKIDSPQVVRKLLRDVKGIFEIAGVHFLVSVSEEAAAALQLGTLDAGGRNEFNSSFYTVLELPPLSPADTLQLLRSRNPRITERQANLLCLLAAGNFREIVRLTERVDAGDFELEPGPEESWRLVASTLEQETTGLLREILGGATAGESGRVNETAMTGAWQALPRTAFCSADSFATLSRTAIHEFWQPGWADDPWKTKVQESWRRLLIRLFVAGAVITHLSGAQIGDSGGNEMIADLRDVLIMAAHSTEVARLMLAARFGDDLSSPYLSGR